MPSRPRSLGLVCLIVSVVVLGVVPCRAANRAAGQPANVPAKPGSFLLRFDTATRKHQPYRELVEESGRFQAVVEELNATFLLPANVTISFSEGDGPLYDPDTKTITMNYEFVANSADIFEQDGQDLTDEEIDDNILGVVEFVLYHEMGHALVDVYELPITGKEEDSVDALATVMAVITDRQEIALAGVDLFNAWAAERGELTEEDFWDEHSLDEQRMYSVICWLVGSNRKQFAELAKVVEMPEDREDQCEVDWNQKFTAWSKLLANHLRPSD